jgi:hypothetical protein
MALIGGPRPGRNCPALDTLSSPPAAQKDASSQYAGRILRPCDGKTAAEVNFTACDVAFDVACYVATAGTAAG